MRVQFAENFFELLFDVFLALCCSPRTVMLCIVSAPVINGGVRGVWGNSAPSSGQENSHSQPPGPPPAPYGHGSGVPGEQAGTGVREPVGRTGGGDSDGGYEGKLVEEICSAGGTKSTPGKVCQVSVFGGRWSMVDGSLSMVDFIWLILWSMVDGPLLMVGFISSMVDGYWSMGGFLAL